MKSAIKSIIIFLLATITLSCNKNATDFRSAENASFIIYTYDAYGCPSGSGSGFFIDETGIGITNYHVLEGSAKAIIVTNDSSKFEIDKIILADEKKDVIKFQIKNEKQKKIQYLTFSKKEPIRGSKVFCISNPLGLENSLSEGIISAIRTDKKHGKTIQFTAPISPGSSGGAIMNEDGDVIAIATFNKRYGQNLNFGIYLNDEILNGINTESFTKKNPKFSRRGKFVILNLKAENDPFTILNAIDFGDDITTLYFTYTRLNIEPGVGKWGFWFELNKEEEGFYIKDIETKNKYYITSSTIGEDREHMTKVPLSTSFKYKVFLPKFSSPINKIEIAEGYDSRASRWSSINLNDYRNLDKFDNDK